MITPANEHNWLEARQAFLKEAGFSVTLLDDPALTMEGGRMARISLNGEAWEIFLSDEFRDLEKKSPPLSAEVVLRACSEYLDHRTSDEWCKAESIPARCHLPLKLRWAEFREAAGHILFRMKPLYDQISDWDWQLNAGRAQVLRGLQA